MIFSMMLISFYVGSTLPKVRHGKLNVTIVAHEVRFFGCRTSNFVSEQCRFLQAIVPLLVCGGQV